MALFTPQRQIGKVLPLPALTLTPTPQDVNTSLLRAGLKSRFDAGSPPGLALANRQSPGDQVI